ncbi:MAG: hypothetical protein IJS14_11650 [Lentisphaeria bacterium]|nr:hypothetical protein [Lentisphaeria bacterium]
MKFAKCLLDDYLLSEQGHKLFRFFENFRDNFLNHRDTFCKIVDSFLDLAMAEWYYSEKSTFRPDIDWKKYHFDQLEDFISKCSLPQIPDKDDAHNELCCLPFDSVSFFINAPEFSFPYLFPEHYCKFAEICEIFEIPLPPIPARTRYIERYNFYFSLCRALFDFRKRHALSPLELCVFLYGFAPRFLQKYVRDELPDANRIYIVGATPDDAKTFESLQLDDLRLWQGNEDMLPGDIVLMYETAPYSRLGSIWRAVSAGYDDPFCYYPGKIFLGYPVKIPDILFSELAQDPVWSKKGLVSAHMQGVNGRLCSSQEYEQVIRIAKKKNKCLLKPLDLSHLPRLAKYSQSYHDDLVNERDIEEKLLEPFLKQIGYRETEWKRQLPIRMGRGFRYYPDYAIHVGKNNEAAEFIWEAKYRIPSQRQLQEDFLQAKSYALRLQCKGLGLVSQEGIWISSNETHFDFEKKRFSSWDELSDPDTFAEIKNVIWQLCNPSRHK